MKYPPYFYHIHVFAHCVSLIYILCQALIELLDQVEDVISVEESVCNETEACFDIGRSIVPESAAKQPFVNSKKLLEEEASIHFFLVLEVILILILDFISDKWRWLTWMLLSSIASTGFREAWRYWFYGFTAFF